jgi:hypothetical protein
MANDTLIQSGRFTSDGNTKILQFRQDVDWLWTYNYTEIGTQQNVGEGVSHYWQRGMSDDTCIEIRKQDLSVDTIEMLTRSTAGVTLVDTSADPNGAIDTTISAVSAAAVPVVTVTSTAALRDNDIVRLINVTGAQQLGGIDFTIAVTAGTTFELAYMAQIVAGTTGSFQLVKYDPIFYPRRRFISSITQATQAVVELTVTHGYTVGQVVRFIVPDAYGMKEMDGLTGVITAVSTDLSANTNTITVDIDSQGFTAFAFPLTAAYPFTQAQIVPVGEASDGDYVDTLDDGTLNSSYIALKLAAGLQSPAGEDGDVIYWVAGKTDLVTNE